MDVLDIVAASDLVDRTVDEVAPGTSIFTGLPGGIIRPNDYWGSMRCGGIFVEV